MSRRTLVLLVIAFVVTRAILMWDAARPTHTGAGYGDMVLYSSWAQQVVHQNLAPYAQVAIEYPPGVLPFIIAPEIVQAGGDEYRERFVLLMLLVDTAGFAALLLMARRLGNASGPWLWIVAVTVLGPIVYLRLDLIPAVMTLWALERASAGAFRTSGGLWGLAILAKLYPILLLPGVLLASSKRREILLGAVAVASLVLIGFSGALDHLWRSVIGYHFDRGIQVESTWAMLLLTAGRRGYDISVGYGFGAYEVTSTISALLKKIATVTSVVTLVLGTWAIARGPRDDPGRLSAGLFGLLAALLGVGTVLSPQFIVWLIALAAAAIGYGVTSMRLPLLAVVPIAALTQLIFPYWYGAVVEGTPKGIMVLAARDLMLIAVGAVVLLELWGQPHTNRSGTALATD